MHNFIHGPIKEVWLKQRLVLFFSAIEDKHKLQKPSIVLELLPQIDVDIRMLSNRLIVIELLNSEIIMKKAELF